MKIKRTKTGTKTSDSKHEIVKSEQNGNLNSEDGGPVNNSKKTSNALGVPASPSSSANKRGNNSHRKDKVRRSTSAEETIFNLNLSEQGKISDKGQIRHGLNHSGRVLVRLGKAGLTLWQFKLRET
jgi:hypothetical protein